MWTRILLLCCYIADAIGHLAQTSPKSNYAKASIVDPEVIIQSHSSALLNPRSMVSEESCSPLQYATMVHVLHHVSNWAHLSFIFADVTILEGVDRLRREEIIRGFFHDTTDPSIHTILHRLALLKREAARSARIDDPWGSHGGGAIKFDCEQNDRRFHCYGEQSVRIVADQNRIILVSTNLRRSFTKLRDNALLVP